MNSKAMRAAVESKLATAVLDRLTMTFSALRMHHRWIIDSTTGVTKLVFDHPFFLPLSFAFEVGPHEFMGVGRLIDHLQCKTMFPNQGHAHCRFWGPHETCEPDPAEVERLKRNAEEKP